MTCPWTDPNYKDLIGPEYRSYVSNLPCGTSENVLKDAFSSYRPLSTEVPHSRGFGSVQFDDQKALDDAIQGMNGQQIGGRTIFVSQANDHPRRWKA
ncbi:hypothetical protein U9M48_043989 [Paspalum notatum var. saurae]|uniref:RRM domain-containing protein n=1 Tax=Paspalum notatum var. saurae TaxID=547442 RepID=A0AAQ3XHR1_PASNO